MMQRGRTPVADRDIAGLMPNDIALPLQRVRRRTDVGTGFIGPVSFPTKAQFDAVLNGTKAIKAPYAALY